MLGDCTAVAQLADGESLAITDDRLARRRADHARVWAWRQTIGDPDHLAAAKVLRRERVGMLRPAVSRKSNSGHSATTTPR